MTALHRILNMPPDPAKVHAPFAPTKVIPTVKLNVPPTTNEFAETKRIVNLPVAEELDEHERNAFSYLHVQASAYEKGFRLFPVQCDGLLAYQTLGGMFGPIGCGHGKTLLSLLCAAHGYSKGIERILLLIPANVAEQFTTRSLPEARLRIPIPFPIHILHGRDAAYRKALCDSKRKGLYVMPYSLLSAKDASDMLEAIQPGLIVADEGHNLAKKETARTKRILRLVDNMTAMGKKPDFVVMSGTITSKSIRNYHHLLVRALGMNAPLPVSSHLLNDWAVLIDAMADTDDAVMGPSAYVKDGPMSALVAWARLNFPSDHPSHQPYSSDVYGFRRAYQKRLHTAPGVICTGDQSVGTSLVMANKSAGEPGIALKALMDQVNLMWLTPNGDEIEHAIHTWKWLNELSCGFYNELSWPTADEIAKKKNIYPELAADIVTKAKQHHVAGQEYAKVLRKWLEAKAKHGLDTPFLVGADMQRNGAKNVGIDLYKLWREWKDLDFDGRPERNSTAVRVDAYKINAAAAWVREHVAENKDLGAIIWYHHQEIGVWLTEVLRKEHGDRVLHCPAGDLANKQIIDPANGNRIVIASISAHHQGKELQHFQHQYFVQWPRDAKVAEQVMSRTHRYGQKADELIMHTCMSNEFDELNFCACLVDTLYIQQTIGSKYKLIYANYNEPLPKTFPYRVLAEAGLEAHKLDTDHEQIFKEKFGG